MDSEFLTEAGANLVGTFVGAVLAIVSAWVGYRIKQSRDEVRKLQRLIDRIYRSRALRPKPVTERRYTPLSAEERVHHQYVTSAIFTIRHLIEEAANTFSPKAKATAVLDDMYAAVLEYLSATEADERNYLNESMRLREALAAAEVRLKAIHRGLVLREPGGIALTAGPGGIAR